MKSKWNGEMLHGMQELPMETSISIIAGESLWFWIGYGIGAAVNTVTHLIASQPSGQKITNVALA
jgi:hypothetical protein